MTTTTNSRRKWTADDLRFVSESWIQGMSYREIGRRLGQSAVIVSARFRAYLQENPDLIARRQEVEAERVRLADSRKQHLGRASLLSRVAEKALEELRIA